MDVKRKLAEYELQSVTASMKFDEAETGEVNFEKTVVQIDTVDGIRDALKGEKVALLIREQISFSTDGKTEYVINCGDDLFAELTFDIAIDTVKSAILDKTLICYDYKTLAKEHGISVDKFFDTILSKHRSEHTFFE